MSNTERLTSSVSIGKSGSGPRRFRMLANTGAAFERRYGKTVADLSAMVVPKKLPILLNHDENAVVGYADRHELTSEGLVLHGVFMEHEAAAQRVQTLSDSGFPLTASVGVRDIEMRSVEEGKSARLNGKDFTGPITVWTKSALYETSVVTANPADMNTAVAALTGERALDPAAALARMAVRLGLPEEQLRHEAWRLEAVLDAIGHGITDESTLRLLARGRLKAADLDRLVASSKAANA